LFTRELPIKLFAESQIQLFAYDNNTYILRSDLPYTETVTLEFAENVKSVKELKSGREFKINDKRQISLPLMPMMNTLLKVEI
jgi:hypothetical protein